MSGLRSTAQTPPQPTQCHRTSWLKWTAVLLAAFVSWPSPGPVVSAQETTDPPEPAQGAGSGLSDIDLPPYVSAPAPPQNNPLSDAKVALGRALFYDTRLSLNTEVSCATCHHQDKAFTVAEPRHTGALGDRTPRNAPSLANLIFVSYLTWGNLTLRNLEQQMLNPLFGDNPVEMGAGATGVRERILADLADDEATARRFEEAFPGSSVKGLVTWERIIAAIAGFQRTMVSFGSPWDRWLDGDPDALTPEQEVGRDLFFSEELKCGKCHSGPLLSVAFDTGGGHPSKAEIFRNTGLYNLSNGPPRYIDGSRTLYPAPNQGIGEFTQRLRDDGKHRVPSLKNVAVTGPYMHDGSKRDLDEVIDHYGRGGSVTAEGPRAGDGALNPNKDPLVAGFTISADQRRALISFLEALTDEEFLNDPRFSAHP